MMILDTQFQSEYLRLTDLLKGGLAKGEIGVILAPTGVGKTTILTKIANMHLILDIMFFKYFLRTIQRLYNVNTLHFGQELNLIT
jgi:ABC-type lipoprotein export system ATPase subunit